METYEKKMFVLYYSFYQKSNIFNIGNSLKKASSETTWYAFVVTSVKMRVGLGAALKFLDAVLTLNMTKLFS